MPLGAAGLSSSLCDKRACSSECSCSCSALRSVTLPLLLRELEEPVCTGTERGCSSSYAGADVRYLGNGIIQLQCNPLHLHLDAQLGQQACEEAVNVVAVAHVHGTQ